jgi:hypothetical protein
MESVPGKTVMAVTIAHQVSVKFGFLLRLKGKHGESAITPNGTASLGREAVEAAYSSTILI